MWMDATRRREKLKRCLIHRNVCDMKWATNQFRSTKPLTSRIRSDTATVGILSGRPFDTVRFRGPECFWVQMFALRSEYASRFDGWCQRIEKFRTYASRENSFVAHSTEGSSCPTVFFHDKRCVASFRWALAHCVDDDLHFSHHKTKHKKTFIKKYDIFFKFCILKKRNL